MRRWQRGDSGTLLHGLRKQGANDVFDSLRGITCNPDYRRCVEWLGAPWGHAVAPSTPVQDYRLHVKAWQHHFAAIFGFEAVSRVRGFSPSEMALPNHPDVAYEFVKTLKDCGYQWVLVQEHSVEEPADGSNPRRPHLPHRLVCTNSKGETASIIALVKTQGSDTKLVAQMQPAYEARSLGRIQLAGRSVPPLVTQIADGENGGVMMNEFPSKYLDVMREASGSDTPAMNGTEYLERLFEHDARLLALADQLRNELAHAGLWRDRGCGASDEGRAKHDRTRSEGSAGSGLADRTSATQGRRQSSVDDERPDAFGRLAAIARPRDDGRSHAALAMGLQKPRQAGDGASRDGSQSEFLDHSQTLGGAEILSPLQPQDQGGEQPSRSRCPV